jgi:hypothetical protein
MIALATTPPRHSPPPTNPSSVNTKTRTASAPGPRHAARGPRNLGKRNMGLAMVAPSSRVPDEYGSTTVRIPVILTSAFHRTGAQAGGAGLSVVWRKWA